MLNVFLLERKIFLIKYQFFFFTRPPFFGSHHEYFFHFFVRKYVFCSRTYNLTVIFGSHLQQRLHKNKKLILIVSTKNNTESEAWQPDWKTNNLNKGPSLRFQPKTNTVKILGKMAYFPFEVRYFSSYRERKKNFWVHKIKFCAPVRKMEFCALVCKIKFYALVHKTVVYSLPSIGVTCDIRVTW